MSVADFSQIIGTAAPAYAQVRQIRDQRKADKTQAQLAREKLAADMSMSKGKLAYDAQQEEAKRRDAKDLAVFNSTYGNPNWNADEEARQQGFGMLSPDFFPPAPPPTPYPWQGQEAMGDATAGPALPRLAENFAPGQRFSAFAKVPEAQKKKLEGEQATIDATKAKTRTEEAALPGVVADAEVKVGTKDQKIIEAYLMNKVKEGDITLAQAQAELAKMNAKKVAAETATEDALRGPTVGKAEADAALAGAKVPFAPRMAEAELGGTIADTRSKNATAALTEKITGPTVGNLKAGITEKEARAAEARARAGVIPMDAETRRMAVKASEAANRIRQQQLTFDKYKYASDGKYRKLMNDKLAAEVANLRSNNAVPGGLKLEIESLNRELSAVANAAGSGLRPDYTQMDPIMQRLERTLRTLPAVVNPPAGMSAATAHLLSKQVMLRKPLPMLQAKYREDMQGRLTPEQIEAGVIRIQKFYDAFTALDVNPEGETLEAAPKPK